MMMLVARLTALVLAASVAGCGESAGAARVIERDSAGITIVLNQVDPGSLPTWSVASTPRLDIGTVAGPEEYQLFRVMDALKADDGRILVVNAGTQELRIYDASGEFVTALGGDGEGPGEYRFPFRIHRLPGDSLLVYDIGLARFTVLDDGGQVGRTFRPERALLNEPEIAGLIGDSLIITHEVLYHIPASGFDTMKARVAFFGLDGEGRDSLIVPTNRMGRAEGLVARPHFEPMTQFAAGANGLWLGTARRPEIRFYGPGRSLRRIVRWTEEPRPVTEEALQSRLESNLAREPEDAARTRSLHEALPAAEAFPHYNRLEVDRRNRLWARRFRPPGKDGPATWLVFEPDGRILARAELPSGLNVHEIGDDYILGTRADELDIQHVMLWSLERATP